MTSRSDSKSSAVIVELVTMSVMTSTAIGASPAMTRA